jgi:aryl-alcohol dehydrogenase-like predicted oxidoreductase
LAREIEAEILPAMQQYGVGLIPFFPLAGGMLTGKYKAGTALPAGSRLTDTKDARFLNEANYARVAKLEAFASERGRTVLELAFSWLLGHAVVASVIAGATTPDQLDANAGAADWALSEDDYREIDRALAPNAA